MKIPDDYEQEIMLHSWKMMKLAQHQSLFYSDFYDNIYMFPNGLRVECPKHLHIRIYVNIEFSAMVEEIIYHWEYRKRKHKNEEVVVYTILGRTASAKSKMRKDFEDLLWDLYSLGS